MVVGTALLMGLYARHRTGNGQYIETTMLGSNLYANSEGVIDYAGKPKRRMPGPELTGLGALYRLYRCREGWVFLACPTQDEWERLCDALGRPALRTDQRFATAAAREEHGEELAAILEAAFGERDAPEWERYLSGRGLACVVADAGRPGEVFNRDPFMSESGLSVEVTHPVVGTYRRHGPSVDFALTPCVAGDGNRNGEHTRSILAELGYSPEQTAALKEAGVVTWPDDPLDCANEGH
jgi:crotonobetainyl-CoA:carnitine CoA-transferase CaiB-like acyl-CoA transferase